MENSFVGRGERRVKQCVQQLFPNALVSQQVPIKEIINYEDFAILGKEHNQHKFDVVVYFKPLDNRSDIVIEVNYKHGPGAVKKWNNVYYPAILNARKIPLTIEDRECKTLFNTKQERALEWGDFEDVIGALKLARIKP